MRILFVAMANSVHTARWISQISHQGWDLHLFAAEATGTHQDLNGVVVHGAKQGSRPRSLAKRALNRLARVMPSRTAENLNADNLRGQRVSALARLIRALKPDVLHSLEMQQAGYLTRDALDQCSDNPSGRWVYSTWGSDLYYFGELRDHAPRIRRTLTACDYLITDCRRDVDLAHRHGFSGEVLGTFPVAGGYRIGEMLPLRQPGPAADRRTIALKGYHDPDWVGRGLVGLEAIHRCRDLLVEYHIVVFCAHDNVRFAAEYVSRITGLKIHVLPFGSPHEEVLGVLGRSRLAVGLSLSDGSPNAMLEAMVMGALPIQSDTVSTAEWIEDGINGLLVPPEDVDIVETAIRRALRDDQLVNDADRQNERRMRETIDWDLLQPQVVQLYERVAGSAARKKKGA